MRVNCEKITHAEYKKLAEEFIIYYGAYSTPFGQCFIAYTQRGICMLAFFDTQAEQKTLLKELSKQWTKAVLVNDEAKIASLGKIIFKAGAKSLKLLLKGSPFQLKVWEALLDIPVGELVGYQEMAIAIEAPTAVRAVASAIAKNNVAYIIPCHRVIRKNGEFGEYRWNRARKRALIEWEAAR